MNRTEFYEASERRRQSMEVDYGYWSWKHRPGRQFRVSWIEQTGELYRIDMRTSEVVVMRLIAERDDVERLMKGWPELCAFSNGLDQLMERIGYAL